MVGRQYEQFITIQRKYVLQDFYEFCKEVLLWKDLNDDLHGSICRFMQDNRDKKRLLLVPRGHLKSTVVTVSYALWSIVRNPKVRILIVNATYDMAITFLNQIKSHLERNEKFIELFGDITSKKEKWSENQIAVKRPEGYDVKEPTITAFGIGGNLVSQHYDIIIMDDIVNRDNIYTPDRIENVKMFYKDVQDLVDNPVTSEIIMVGTRWHNADLYGTLLDPDNPEHYEYAIYQRTAIEGEHVFMKDPVTGRFLIEGGDIIFPKKFTRRGLERLINSKGVSEFSAQYMNEPVMSEMATFKHEFKYYEVEDLKGVELNTFITVDPAFFDPRTKKNDLDYTVFMVIAVDKNNAWYIRDIIRQRMTPKEIVDMLFTLDNQYHPKTFGLETTAYQKVLAFAAIDEMKARNHFIPITELKHAGGNSKSKEERIQALEPRYATGSILHNKYVRNITTLELELQQFPKSKTDDCMDALASMLEIARPPKVFQERTKRALSKFFSYPA